MAKVSVVTPDRARGAPLPAGYSGSPEVCVYLDAERFPLQLHLHRLDEGGTLGIGPMAVDCVAYLWSGAVEAGGHELAEGSSVIIERGASLTVTGRVRQAQLLTFAASHPSPKPLSGGRVHVLPAERVPRGDDLGSGGVGGAMHADSDCPTCDVWLHENHFPPGRALGEAEQRQGIHSHSEDEIIFVTSGEMRLGRKLFGPGTALAIAADTLYSFTPGPSGLSFVNFRADMPGDIRFASGQAISETAYWRDRLPRPDYLEPLGPVA